METVDNCIQDIQESLEAAKAFLDLYGVKDKEHKEFIGAAFLSLMIMGNEFPDLLFKMRTIANTFVVKEKDNSNLVELYNEFIKANMQ